MQDDHEPHYFVVKGERRIGPYTLTQLQQGLEDGVFTAEDELIRSGSDTILNLGRTLRFKNRLRPEPRKKPLKHASGSPPATPGEGSPRGSSTDSAVPPKTRMTLFQPDNRERFDALYIGHALLTLSGLVGLLISVFMGLMAMANSQVGGGLLIIMGGVLLALLLWIMGQMLLCLRAIELNTRRSAAATEWMASERWVEIANERRKRELRQEKAAAAASAGEETSGPSEPVPAPESEPVPAPEFHDPDEKYKPR